MKNTRELVSMVDYVMQCYEMGDEHPNPSDAFYQTYLYAKFLKQPLTLGMFVPCDDEGNVLEEPNVNNYEGKDNRNIDYEQDFIKYNKALDKVVFDGFEVFASTTWTEIRRDNVRIHFDDDEITVEIISSLSVEYEGLVKSISDLCGYGLKYYEQ